MSAESALPSSSSVPVAAAAAAVADPARARAAALTDWALLVSPGLIWGTSFLLIAESLAALAPDGVSFLRFVIGFVALACVPGARRPVAVHDRAGIFWLGLLWLAFPMSMFPHAEQHVSSALTGMLNGAIPLIAAAVAALVAREAPSRGVLLSLGIGVAGTVLMAAPGLGAGGNSARGVLMIGAALVSYGVAINLARPLQQRNGALPVVWRALGVALVLTAPLGAPALLTARWSARATLAILTLGLLGTAAANVIMATAAGRLGPTRASATTFLIPVVALLLGLLVRGEQVALLAAAGGALCLLGAALFRKEAAPRSLEGNDSHPPGRF